MAEGIPAANLLKLEPSSLLNEEPTPFFCQQDPIFSAKVESVEAINAINEVCVVKQESPIECCEVGNGITTPQLNVNEETNSEESQRAALIISSAPENGEMEKSDPGNVEEAEDETEPCAESTNLTTVQFCCKACSIVFKTVEQFTRHNAAAHNIVTARKFVTCDVCGKKLGQSSALYAHKLTHKDPEFKCDFCSQMFRRKADLTEHRRIHTGERPYYCSICGKRYRCSSSYSQHKYTHLDKLDQPYQCPICLKRFAQLTALKSHKNTTHKNLKSEESASDEPLHCCCHCQCFYKRADLLNKHIKRCHSHADFAPLSHSRKIGVRYLCKLCGKGHGSSTGLHNHLFKVHGVGSTAGGKPAQCSVCEKAFSDKSSLAKHMIGHRDKVHKCLECGKGFARKLGLLRHERRMHVPEKPPYAATVSCFKCGNILKNAKTLAKHLRTVHLKVDENPQAFRSETSGKIFGNSQSLKNHSAASKCQYCEKTFSTIYRCKTHEITVHTKDFPWKCERCDKGFFSAAKLKKHESFEHGKRFFD